MGQTQIGQTVTKKVKETIGRQTQTVDQPTTKEEPVTPVTPVIVRQPTTEEEAQLISDILKESTDRTPKRIIKLAYILTGHPPAWIAPLWTELTEFAQKEYNNDPLFLEAVMAVTNVWRGVDFANIGQDDEKTYADDMNAIYNKYMSTSAAVEVNIGSNNKYYYAQLHDHGWRDESGHLLSPVDAFRAAEQEVVFAFNTGVWPRFKKSPEMKEWVKQYGAAYQQWYRVHAPPPTTAYPPGTARTTGTAHLSHAAHDDGFNELNDVYYQQGFITPGQGVNDYYDIQNHQYLDGQLYDTNIYDYYKTDIINIELMALIGVIVFILMAICCLCNLFICSFNACLAYIYYTKSEKEKRIEMFSYSEDNV